MTKFELRNRGWSQQKPHSSAEHQGDLSVSFWMNTWSYFPNWNSFIFDDLNTLIIRADYMALILLLHVHDEIVWKGDDLAFFKAVHAWKKWGKEKVNINHDDKPRTAIHTWKLTNAKFSTSTIASFVTSVKYSRSKSSLGTPALGHK